MFTPCAVEPDVLVAGLSGVRERTVALGQHGFAAFTDTQLRDWLRAAQRSVDVLGVVVADGLAELVERDAFRDDGAPSIGAWAQHEMNVPAARAKALVKAHRTMQQLPLAGEAARTGQIGIDHVRMLTAAVTRTGLEQISACESTLVDLARKVDPFDLNATARDIHEALNPDSLDEPWADGMAQHDFRVDRVGTGASAHWAVTGYLDTLTGAKLHEWLDSASAPRSDDPASPDERSPAQRRVDALNDLLESVLRHGLPSDHGIRPQVHVTVDVETFRRQPAWAAFFGGRAADRPGRDPWTTPTPTDAASNHTTSACGPGDRADSRGLPADLAGWGFIGSDLLGYLVCEADVTAILTDDRRDTHGGGAPPVAPGGVPPDGPPAQPPGSDPYDFPLPQANVLNVGRTQRLATMKQRTAVLHRQDGICANPTCRSRHLDVHHVAFWQRDEGRTDLDNLIGLCARCHALVHTGRLAIHPDGAGSFLIRTGFGRPLPDHRRRHRRDVRRRLRAFAAGSDIS